MLWIISGPSSAGKSRFLLSPRCQEITGLPPGTPVVWPLTSQALDGPLRGDLFYHYDVLRPLTLRSNRKPKGLIWALSAGLRLAGIRSHTRTAAGLPAFEADPKWKDLTHRDMEKKAVVLVAKKETILRRMRERKIIERKELNQWDGMDYPVGHFLQLLRPVDLAALYQAWCRELERQDIPYLLIDSTGDAYPILNDSEAFKTA